MELIFGGLLSLAMMYIYHRYKERVYKRKVRPLSYFREISDATLAAIESKINQQPVIKITGSEFRGEVAAHVIVNQTLVEIVNPSRLPKGYLGQWREHLFEGSAGNAPLWLDRVTLAVVTTSVEVAIQHTSTDRHLILHFNPNQIRGDLLGSYLNIFLGALDKD